jgi:hypothetical protein
VPIDHETNANSQTLIHDRRSLNPRRCSISLGASAASFLTADRKRANTNACLLQHDDAAALQRLLDLPTGSPA